jgi:hypothetical protein
MTVCTAITCIDGRFHRPVVKFLRRRLRAGVVDLVTEAAAVRVLAQQRDVGAIESIMRGVRTSVHFHESRLVAVVAHDDCAANAVPSDHQIEQVASSAHHVKRRFPETRVVGLWVDRRGRVRVVWDGGNGEGTSDRG